MIDIISHMVMLKLLPERIRLRCDSRGLIFYMQKMYSVFTERSEVLTGAAKRILS